jgi:hypothetical protein
VADFVSFLVFNVLYMPFRALTPISAAAIYLIHFNEIAVRISVERFLITAWIGDRGFPVA